MQGRTNFFKKVKYLGKNNLKQLLETAKSSFEGLL